MSQRGRNPRSIQNLKPWPKGVSGNPGGRSHASKQAQADLEALAPDAVRVFAHFLRRKNLRAAEKVVEHAIPKPAQEVTGAGGGPLEVIVKYADRE